MAVAWPVGLPSVIEEPSYGLEFGDSRLRSQMDVGPAKVRRRSTREIDNHTGVIRMTTAQYTTFRTFYKTDLNGGVTPFTIAHPISGETLTFRFVEKPTWKPIGGNNWDVSMSWEELP